MASKMAFGRDKGNPGNDHAFSGEQPPERSEESWSFGCNARLDSSSQHPSTNLNQEEPKR
jgi:hypothetical protein